MSYASVPRTRREAVCKLCTRTVPPFIFACNNWMYRQNSTRHRAHFALQHRRSMDEM